MEIIIALVAVALAAAVYLGRKKNLPTQSVNSNEEWPFGTKLAEGKIHVKTDEVSSTVVEAVTTVVENKPAKKTVAKKAPAKKAAAKKSPAKKTAKSKKV